MTLVALDRIGSGHRRIKFAVDGSEVSVRQDDYTASGAYSCKNKEGEIVLDKGEPVGSWRGYYNAETNVLLFDGAWYKESK